MPSPRHPYRFPKKPRRGISDESSEPLLYGAQSIEATPPLRKVTLSGGFSVPAFSLEEVTLLYRHRRCRFLRLRDKALPQAATNLSRRQRVQAQLS